MIGSRLPSRDGQLLHDLANRLHGDPAKVNPAGWEADFAAAPWPVKIYQGGRRYRLGGYQPSWLPESTPDPLGRLLHYSAGFTVSRYAPGGIHLSSPEQPAAAQPGRRLTARRAVPSGGSMYPTEVYLVSCVDVRWPAGVYHYSPVGHELVDLGMRAPAGAVAGAMASALRLPGNKMPPHFLVLTSRFWKNFHKYGDFSYRLGAVDLGVVLGRLLQFRNSAPVYPGFRDDELDALLGLDGRTEASYVAIGLGPHDGSWIEPPSTFTVPRPNPPAVLSRAPEGARSIVFDAAHAAARRAKAAPGEPCPAPETAAPQGIPLPAAAGALAPAAHVLTSRTSAANRFTGAGISGPEFAAILQQAASVLRRLHQEDGFPLVELACAVREVDGVPAGFHLVRHDARALHPVSGAVDPGPELWRAMHMHNLNPELAAVTVHLTGAADLRENRWGARAYRLQQIAVGVGVDALAMACTRLRIGQHPLLGFDGAGLDRCYRLTESQVLAQVLIGPVRPGLSVEGTVVPSMPRTLE